MILTAENLSRRYFRRTGQANSFFAVKDASIELIPGEVAVLMGRSGSGKTTLMHMLAGLLTPTEGTVRLGGEDIYAMSDGALSRLRNERLGVIPQGRSAIDSLSVLENVLLPGRLYGKPSREDEARRRMAALGIEGLADARPAELSGGELRRMAIARALTQGPEVLLADEPTGDLDDENTARALGVLRDAARAGGCAVLIISHDSEAMAVADRAYRMDGGRLEPCR